MNAERTEELIQAYALGRLTPSELQDLSAAALEDADLFARMASADYERRVLSDPQTRQEALSIVRSALHSPISWRERFQSLFRPEILLSVAACVAALVVAVVYQSNRQQNTTYVMTSIGGAATTAQAKRVSELSTAGPGPSFGYSRAEWMGKNVRQGSLLSIQVKLDTAASFFVVQVLPDETARFVFPSELSETANLAAGEHKLSFDASPPGRFQKGRVRLLIMAFPPDVEVRIPSADLQSAKRSLSFNELSYVLMPTR